MPAPGETGKRLLAKVSVPLFSLYFPTREWIATRLAMGSASYLSALLGK